MTKTYQQQLTEFKKRRQAVVRMRDRDKLTFVAIGLRLKPPITAQRACQLYKQEKAS